KGIAALPVFRLEVAGMCVAFASRRATPLFPIYLLLAVTALAEPHSALASALANPTAPAHSSAVAEPSLGGLSMIDPLPAVPPLAAAEEIRDSTQPAVVFTESPESEWLASWQAGYLQLLGDDGRALAGFYDPFSYQFAYGSAGVQPYRLGWYSYNDYVLMSSA